MSEIVRNYKEQERDFLQKRSSLFALILFLLNLWTGLLEIVTLPRTWQPSIQYMIPRGITLTLALMWLILRKGRHSERVVHTIEAVGLSITTVGMALTSRYAVTDIVSDMAFSMFSSDPLSPDAVHAADMFTWFVFVSGGSLVFFLRSALVPSSPVRTLVLTAIVSLP